MIYINDHVQDINIEESLPELSLQRREKVLRFRSEGGKKLSIAAYLLLRRALDTEFGITAPPEFVFSDNGKPFLKHHPEIFFSLSHSGNVALCAVDLRPLGADIETPRKVSHDVVEYVMNCDEQKFIATSPDPHTAFLNLWTKKEALLKLQGSGIGNDMKNVLENSRNYCVETYENEKMVYSIAVHI